MTFGAPFGNYAGDVTGVVDATAAAEIAALLDALKLLLPDPSVETGVVAEHPDFDMIPAHTSAKLRAEIDAVAAHVAAAPTA